MLIFAHVFIDSSGEEALPKELGCAKRGRFLHNFLPDSSGEEALPKGARRRQKVSIFAAPFFQILVVRKPLQRVFGC